MTVLRDQVVVFRLACLTEDLGDNEVAALERVAARIEAEAHRQTTTNRYLVPDYECAHWMLYDPPDDRTPLFADDLDREGIIRTATTVAVLSNIAQPRLLASQRLSATGLRCTYSDDHSSGCICRGCGVARPLAANVLGQGPAHWLHLTRFISRKVPTS